MKHELRSLWRDNINLFRYKDKAPLYAELIWIEPAHCKAYMPSQQFKSFFGLRLRQASGLVVDRWPEDLVQDIYSHKKISYCLSRWRDGKEWEECGAVEYMLKEIGSSPNKVFDECRNRKDVLKRFSALDKSWHSVQEKGRLLTRQEIFPSVFREVGGILVHLGPNGVPVFSGAGCHRMAMALMLGVPFPAQLGCVHVSAIDSLPKMRLQNKFV